MHVTVERRNFLKSMKDGEFNSRKEKSNLILQLANVVMFQQSELEEKQ